MGGVLTLGQCVLEWHMLGWRMLEQILNRYISSWTSNTMLTTTCWNKIMTHKGRHLWRWEMQQQHHRVGGYIWSRSPCSVTLQPRGVSHEGECYNVPSSSQCLLTYNSQPLQCAQYHETSPTVISKSPP